MRWLPLLLVALASGASAETPSAERVTVVAVGDVLPHRRVKQTAREHGWAYVFGAVSERIRSADVAFANLESPVAPDQHLPLHGHVFNAPASLPTGLAKAGFDVVSLANNHAWDQGPEGLVETHRRVVSAGLVPVGAGPNCADALRAQVIEVRGVRIAFLAFTDIANFDIKGSAKGPCLATTGPVCDEDCGPDRDAFTYSVDLRRLIKAIKSARVQADAVVLSVHWGMEYQIAARPQDIATADALLDAGVDVLLGHHSHVLGPVRHRSGRVAAMSLGNFVSDMGRSYDPATQPPRKGHTRDGALFSWTFVMQDGEVRVEDALVEPLWTDNREEGIRVLPLDLVEPELRAVRRAAVQAAISP